MTDHIADTDRDDDDLERDAGDEQVNRAPAPGNTPAPGEPPLESGEITGGMLVDDH